jgi:hypothetical protein
MTFDGGRLSSAMMFLSSQSWMQLPVCADKEFAKTGTPESRNFILKQTERAIAYCEEMSFSMAKIPLDRILELVNDESIPIQIDDLGHLFEDAKTRLRDEASACLFLRVAGDRVGFYSHPKAGWEEVIKRFPATTPDIEEASICFALERYAACVFHCVQIIESGLIELGIFLGVKDPKSGWTSTANELDKITTKKYKDLTEPEERHIGFLKQVQATIVALGGAWRNKISHAQGRLAVMTADFSPRVAEEILMASRGFMRRLATDLPSCKMTDGTPKMVTPAPNDSSSGRG